ncbi:LamG-like jellyroll fold domain-containing protein [Actinoplanes sp. NPDC049265]|uniref:LamG-like jellyroll fold domain-containing protein n=1 Tax=Actinoplanes sp. NPDC049265 TaxID=3363902 RepID=UPI00371FD0D1
MVSLAPYRRRLSLTTTVLTALAAGLLTATPPANAAVPANPQPAGKRAEPPTDPVAAAISKAQAEGQQVPVPRLTDEYSTTTANPDGTLTTIHSSAPERAKQGDAWVPIDTTLVRQSNGSYAPRAATAGLSVAADRSTALLTMRQGSRQISFTWPQALPTPVVSGDTATYPEVYPGVDLQITADPTGYSSVFVVKTRDAARSTALRTIDFGVSGTNVRIGEITGGGAEAVDTANGEQVFHTDTALMWDSTPLAAAAKAPDKSARTEDPGPQQPGRNVAEVQIDIEQGKQRLTLDQNLLTSTATTFPVYVDPVWSGSPAPSQLHWARISSNGWDYYNSTSKTGATSARIGLDDWPNGAGETARTYYHMNTSGIRGAEIFRARLYVVERHASSCSNTAAVVYATARPSAWKASALNWGKQPAKKSSLLSSVTSRQVDCNTSKERVSPASLNFNVLSYMKAAAASQMSNVAFVVQAADERDRLSWKQLGYGGGATLSVTYSYKPQFVNGTGKPRLTPAISDGGKLVTSSRNPTLSALGFTPKVNGQQENVQITYQIFFAGVKARSGTGPANGYSLNGTPWQVPNDLPDGNYTWKAAIKNASGVWGGVWSTTQAFTVDTKKPNPPQIKSTQFPPDQLGSAYTDRGVFELIADKTNNVNSYLFTLDGDLSDTTAAGQGIPWTSTTVIEPGKVYLAKADNGNGTDTVVINGSAGVTFAPGTTGAHKIAAKTVDQAGSTSTQTVYSFFAGTSTPTYATGDKLISGWTATNSDGSTTVVPPAATTSQTAMMVAQASKPGRYYISESQAFLANRSTTSKVANGDSATFSIDLPTSGPWEIGANLTTAADYGTYTLTLDKGTPTQTTLITGFDAYSTGVLTTYRNFGIVKDGTTPRQLAAGLHTITLDVTGKNSASTGYQAAVDAFRLAPALSCAINDTSRCLNNTAISTYTAGSTPTVTPADATGTGLSIDAAGLRAAGWTPGNTVTLNGAAIKLPAVFGTGAPDNMLSNGQMITVPSTGVINRGNALVLAGFATGSIPAGKSGTITYGSGCDLASQPFTLDAVTDWAATPPAESVLTFPRRNKSNATQENVPVSLVTITVPLLCPGVPVTGITLPLISTSVAAATSSLHLLGLGIRPTSATGTSTAPVRWTGSWATAQDTGAVKQTSGTTTVDATLNNQTVRIPAQLSIGTAAGHQIRVRLANSLGKTPVTFDAVTLALQDPAAGATAATTPTPVTFNGARDLTLPAGADILSDPVSLAAPDRATVLVSAKVRGNLTTLSGHQDGRTPIYVSAADNTDHTGEKAATNFTSSVILGTPFLAGIDVTTSATHPAGAVVLYGDQTVNADTATRDGHNQLDSQLAAALAAAPETGNTVPFGVLNLGSSSTGNKAKLPSLGGEPTTATTAVDRAVLNQSNVRAVLISAGSNDLMACTATTAEACADPVRQKLVALATQLRRFTTDDATDQTRIPRGEAGALKVYVATLPPFTTTATATQEAARKQVNEYILGIAGSTNLQGVTDGVINFAEAVSTDGDHLSSTTLDDYLGTSSPRMPNDDYYKTLAEQYLINIDDTDWITEDQSGGTEPGADPIAVWKFGEGSGTTAQDTGTGTGTAPVKHDATLHQVSWGDSRIARRSAGTFNGTSSYADTDLRTNTAQSFTISTWVRLTDKSSDRTVFARESDGFASFNLRYQQSSDRWVAQMPSAAAGDSVVWHDAIASLPARTGLWTHLAATYDADLKTLTLTVNGEADTSVEQVTAFNDPNGPTWIGRSDTSWFSGNIADVKVWHRALNDAELATEAAATLVAKWELEDDAADPAKVVDTSGEGNDGTLVGAATYATPGHFEWDNRAVRLNGTTDAITTPQLLRTDQSFTVAAWAKISRTDGTYTVLSQDGNATGRFMLQWSGPCICWRFVIAENDQATATTSQAASPSVAPVDTWTHLAGSYDATTGAITLYVNGEAANSATTTTAPWTANGSFTAGRTRRNSTNAEWFPGDLDSVRAYQGVLSPEAIRALSLN